MKTEDILYSAKDLVRVLEIIYGEKKLNKRSAAAALSDEYRYNCEGYEGNKEIRHKGKGNFYYYKRPIVEAVIKNRDPDLTDRQLQKAFSQLEYERLEYEFQQWSEDNPVPMVENLYPEELQEAISAQYLDDFQEIQEWECDDDDIDVGVAVDKIVNHFPYLKLEIMLNKLLEIENYSFDSEQLLSDLIVDKSHEILGDFDDNHDILGIRDARERLEQPKYDAYFSKIETNRKTRKRNERTDQTVGFKK
ncbi:hypothetical protein [Streptococcus orisratti]|uniref:hypothetical protein n=1 Tax=Streptococcus orisratti TaxID=114652 RepID=UPI003D027A60